VKKLVITLTLAAGLCGAFVWLPDVCGQNSSSAARAAKPVGPSRIAFVDMGQILRSYAKAADVLQEVKAFEDANSAKIGQMMNEGRELEKELVDGSLPRDAPEFAERETKVKQLASRAHTAKSIADAELKQQRGRALLAVYRDVIAAVQQFAEQNRYDLVLQVDRDALAAKSYRTIQQTMAQALICRDDRDDLTDEIIAWLNKQYTAAGAAASPREAPAAKSPSPTSPASTGRKAPAR
jgi:Skp family chaperone for outer membrane proteins